jgi:proteasome activator subunit 4
MTASERAANLISALDTGSGLGTSRATSPGGDWRQPNGGINGVDTERQGRNRPRTFPYFQYLPYQTEGQAEREDSLNTCLKHLYIAVSAGDFAPGAVHWTREIRGWLSLKFDLPRSTRVKLVKLYYELALAPGLDYLVAERFASMFMILTKYDFPLSCIAPRGAFANLYPGESIIYVPEKTSSWTGGHCIGS